MSVASKGGELEKTGSSKKSQGGEGRKKARSSFGSSKRKELEMDCTVISRNFSELWKTWPKGGKGGQGKEMTHESALERRV